jgi:hypothetical protein
MKWVADGGPQHLIAEIERLKQMKAARDAERQRKENEAVLIKEADKLRKELGI